MNSLRGPKTPVRFGLEVFKFGVYISIPIALAIWTMSPERVDKIIQNYPKFSVTAKQQLPLQPSQLPATPQNKARIERHKQEQEHQQQRQ